MTREEMQKTSSDYSRMLELEELVRDFDGLDLANAPVEALEYVLQEGLYDGDALDDPARRIVIGLREKALAELQQIAATAGFTYERPAEDQIEFEDDEEPDAADGLPPVGEMLQVPA